MNYADYIKDRFTGQDVHVVGSGPSLYGFDYRKFAGKIVIATNHAYRCLNAARVECYVVINDVNFYLREDKGRVLQTPGVRVLAAKQTQIPAGNNVILYDFNREFSFDSASGVYGREVAGATALCIALQGGAKRVFLWGLDSRLLKDEELRIAANKNGTRPPADKKFLIHATDGMFDHSVTEEKYAHLYTDKTHIFDQFPDDRVFNMSRFSIIKRFSFILPEEVM